MHQINTGLGKLSGPCGPCTGGAQHWFWDNNVIRIHALSHPGDALAQCGSVTPKLDTVHVRLPQHPVPDPKGSRSYQEPGVCFTKGTGLTNTSWAPFWVKTWMEISGHLSGTPMEPDCLNGQKLARCLYKDERGREENPKHPWAHLHP